MFKYNTLRTKLLPHQKKPIRDIGKLPGMLLYHGVGSGKTLTSIGIANKYKKRPLTVVAPAALLPNHRKELDKHLTSDTDLDVRFLSTERIQRDPSIILPPYFKQSFSCQSPHFSPFQILGSPLSKRYLRSA